MDARPPYFFLKKYAIMGFTVVQIILMIIFAIIAGIAIGAVNSGAVVEGDKGLATGVLIFALIVCILAIIFHLIGFFGALKENFCLSCTYAVLCFINLVFGIVAAISGPIYWLSTVIAFLVFIAAILFTIDLRKIRLGQVQPTY